ncbi:acyltransferase [Plantibacter flavus]|uniref:acyltransferase family protein n=1 Tax=Plantibacter flavus TaxID=150123 RepID=UPI003F134C4B
MPPLRQTDASNATGSARRCLDAFAGARALAAWWVVFSHSWEWLSGVLPELAWLAPFAHTGLAVDFFFILSGFTIAEASIDRTWTTRRYLGYLRNRLARLYPAHLAVLLLFVALFVGGALVGIEADEGAFPWLGFAAELTLTRAWFGDALWWNAPAWSLSAQLFAFLVFPAVAVAFRGRLRRTTPLLLIAVMLIIVDTAAAATAPSAMNGMAWPVVRVLCGFIVGVCVALGTRQLPRTPVAAWVAAGGALGLLAAAVMLEPGAPRAWAAVTFGAIVVAGLATASPRSTRLLRNRAARILGELAFSTYLVHLFVIIVLAKTIEPATVTGAPLVLRAAVLIVWFGSILGAAWLLHTMVESPAHRRFSRRMR